MLISVIMTGIPLLFRPYLLPSAPPPLPTLQSYEDSSWILSGFNSGQSHSFMTRHSSPRRTVKPWNQRGRRCLLRELLGKQAPPTCIDACPHPCLFPFVEIYWAPTTYLLHTRCYDAKSLTCSIFPKQPCEGGSSIILISQMGKLRLHTIKSLAQGYILN